VDAERKVTFRIVAPNAQAVRVTGGDMPGIGRGEMTKGENNVWEATIGPVPAGAYRYNFNVDGVTAIDPRNPATSESNNNTWSLVVVPGSDLFDTKNVPHGAVAEVNYHSESLKRNRRMHVYTPPGYETSTEKYPVFYLLHGASDSDNSWSTVGRAGFILDNLIAAGKAKPMLVVMPAGHTSAGGFGRGGRRGGGAGAGGERPVDEFTADFVGSIRPYIEKTYRVKTDRGSRAIAGLSMGGAQTLNIAIPKLEDYGYVGVYSSGVFGIAGGRGGGAGSNAFEEQNLKVLDNADLKNDLKLVWFGIGKDDFLLETSRSTVKMLEKHNFKVTNKETDGGHTWLVWRDYLAEFAPQLFQ
jgi:enterochelin esterase family protein